jgi:uncharacterized protein YrrD
MQFNQGAHVFTQDNKQVGRIERVVIDPNTKQVTHLVTHKGSLLGEEVQDKVVPVEEIVTGEKERISLRVNADQFARMPNFQEMHYVVVNEEELARGSDNRSTWFTPTLYHNPPYEKEFSDLAYTVETETHIPEGTIAVEEGAKVVTSDNKSIGNVEQVLTDPATNRATHFLVSHGLLHKEKKLLPVEWIASFGESELRLAVGSRIIEHLAEMEHA